MPAPAGYRGGPQQAVGYANGNGYQPQQQLASWSLHNRSNERIQFQTFDPARGTWKNQVSFPHQTTPYTMSPGVMAGKIRIATTNRGYVEYDVEAGGSYSDPANGDSLEGENLLELGILGPWGYRVFSGGAQGVCQLWDGSGA